MLYGGKRSKKSVRKPLPKTKETESCATPKKPGDNARDMSKRGERERKRGRERGRGRERRPFQIRDVTAASEATARSSDRGGGGDDFRKGGMRNERF